MQISNFHTHQPLWNENLPGGHHWSAKIPKGTVLEFIAKGENANIAMFMVSAEDHLEKFNMPDSLKAQHTAYLSQGHVLYSDLGRVLASIIYDDHAWNDVFCAPSRAEDIEQHFGKCNFQDARNKMYRNGFDSLLIEMSKYKLGVKDLVATVNLFSKVVPDVKGQLSYVQSNNNNQSIKIRFEMDCLVFLSNTPHVLDPSVTYQPADIQLSLYRASTLGTYDLCRDACPQNQRGFANNARYFATSNFEEA